MQCYERQAMYLKLYADAVVEIPRLEFDPNLLDEVLSDYGIDRFSRLIALDRRIRSEIITHIKSVIGVETLSEGDLAEGRDCVEPDEFPGRHRLNAMSIV